MGPGCELYFILGLDAILEIPTWKDYAELFNLCHFVVLDRPLEEVLTREVHPGPASGMRPGLGRSFFGIPGNFFRAPPAGRLRHRHPPPGAPGAILSALLPEAVPRIYN